jgi:hypothetical protein
VEPWRSVGADIPVADKLFATINAGYQNNFGKKNVLGTGLTAADDHLLPVKAGLKYFPVPGSSGGAEMRASCRDRCAVLILLTAFLRQ